jgi:hypothetical protein
MASHVFVRISPCCRCIFALALGLAPDFAAAAQIADRTRSGALLQVGLNVTLFDASAVVETTPASTRPSSALHDNASLSNLGSATATHPSPPRKSGAWATQAIGQTYKEKRFVNLDTALFGGTGRRANESGKHDEVEHLLAIQRKRMKEVEDTIPTASSVWSDGAQWGSVLRWHPAGVVSNINNGRVEWTTNSYVSLNVILGLTLVAYPFLLIFCIFVLLLLVSVCMKVEEDDENLTVATVANYDICSPDVPIPILSVEQLSPYSRTLYKAWKAFCYSIPALTVFGVPVVMAGFSYPRPQEVFSVLAVLTTGCMYATSIYIVIFGTFAMLKIVSGGPTLLDFGRGGTGSAHPTYRLPSDCEDAPETATEVSVEDVLHYVILPQYKEDVETVSMCLESIAASTVAATSICLVLAMEGRETDAEKKAETLRGQFETKFFDIIVTYHPPGLPNDPPGKASNTAWAFKEVLEQLDKKESSLNHRMVVTCADADSHFHERYFGELAYSYLSAGEKCDSTIWQSPVFHVKNYHRQPAPVVVGTVFTAIFEMSCMADPNAIRFPYSSYSLSLELARRVGGWDPQWIAEDWHMGIKCFLLTFGKAVVKPIMLPTINYTPEEDSYSGTITARWTQAKRHALGFSDMSYFFMIMPLIFGHAVLEATRKGKNHLYRDLLSLVCSGVGIVVKIVNVHVLLGVFSTYGFFSFVLSILMEVYFQPDRLVENLLGQSRYVPNVLFTGTSVCTFVMTVLWMVLYNHVKKDIEPPTDDQRWWFSNRVVHWLYVVISFQVYGLVYFTCLALATWKAAWGCLTLSSFEYEVASKPTKASRLGS